MSMTRKWFFGGTAAAWLLLSIVVPEGARAQDRNCQGYEPEGGKWSTSAELYLQRARRNTDPQEKQERYLDAIEVLKEGFQEQPNNPRNYAMAGQAYAGLGDYVNADSVFTKAEELWSCYEGYVDTLRYNAWVTAFNSAVRYAQSGDNERAAEMYRNAWAVYSDLPQPMIQLGGIFAQQGMDAESAEARQQAQDKAVEAYEKALTALADPASRLSDDQVSEYARAATFNLAQLLAFQGRYEKAAEAYQDFLTQEPDNIDALSNMAVVATRAATEAEREAADLEEGAEKETLMAKADSLRSVAAVYYTDLLQRGDLEPGDYFNLGVGLARLRNYDEAVQAFTMTLDYVPYHHDALEQIALALFQQQDYDSLTTVAQTLLDRYPLNLNYMALLANAYRELDQREDALEVLEMRDSLRFELSELEFEASGEGQYTVSGELHNVKGEPGAAVTVVFDFYDDAGEMVASETVTLEAPEQGATAEFSVSTESPMLVSGFTYHRQQPETASGGG